MLNWHSRVVDVSLNGLNLVSQFTNHSVSFVGLFYIKNDITYSFRVNQICISKRQTIHTNCSVRRKVRVCNSVRRKCLQSVRQSTSRKLFTYIWSEFWTLKVRKYATYVIGCALNFPDNSTISCCVAKGWEKIYY